MTDQEIAIALGDAIKAFNELGHAADAAGLRVKVAVMPHGNRNTGSEIDILAVNVQKSLFTFVT